MTMTFEDAITVVLSHAVQEAPDGSYRVRPHSELFGDKESTRVRAWGAIREWRLQQQEKRAERTEPPPGPGFFISINDARQLFGDIAAIAAEVAQVNRGLLAKPDVADRLDAIADRCVRKATRSW